MTTPVQLSDLPVASVAADNDLMLLRKGLTDYQVTVQIIRNIDLTALSPIPSPEATDLILLSRASQNYSARFDQIGFVKNVKAWFYQAVAPSNWTIIPNTGNRLLAVSDGVNLYSGAGGGTAGGTWQQTSTALTIAQIPAHTHLILKTKEPSGSSNALGPQRGKVPETPDATGFATSEATGGSQGHNHGNTWRPLANVGILCNKTT